MKLTFFSILILLAYPPLDALAGNPSERVYLSKLIAEIDYLMKSVEVFCAENSCVLHDHQSFLADMRTIRSGMVEHTAEDFSQTRLFDPLIADYCSEERPVATDTELERVILVGVILEIDAVLNRRYPETYTSDRYTFQYRTLQTELRVIRSIVSECIESDLSLPKGLSPLHASETAGRK